MRIIDRLLKRGSFTVHEPGLEAGDPPAMDPPMAPPFEPGGPVPRPVPVELRPGEKIRIPDGSRLTTDPDDSRLGHGIDTEETDQQEVYLVLSADELARGFVRPVRREYVHDRGTACGVATTMGNTLAETYARDPKFYGATYCAGCHKHLDVREFSWNDGQQVGS